MTVDANKTGETRRVTELAAQWLAEKGFKPVESEVPIAERWVADVAGFASLTRTESVNMHLVPRRPSWGKGYQQAYQIWNEAFEKLPPIITAAIEVKTSRSDFTRDNKWTRPQPCHLLYVAAPSGLLKKIETKIPDNIGILSCTETIRCTRRASLGQHLTDGEVALFLFQVAVRRDHFTAYERFREFNRQARERHNERTNLARVRDVSRAVMSVVRGEKSPQEALRYYGIKIGNGDAVRELEQLRPIESEAH